MAQAMKRGAPPQQRSLFAPEEPSPAGWEREGAQRALDELFTSARRYQSSSEYRALLEFIRRFRFYSPFNAMLVHIQMPGATFVAPAYRWRSHWRRRIDPGARPLVVLQPMGPVMFVFDVSQTQPESDDAPPLPRDVERPFNVGWGRIGGQLELTIENAKRDGVLIAEQEQGSMSAGLIRRAERGWTMPVLVQQRPEPRYRHIPVRYELVINSRLAREAKYTTLVHELAHLYCGHLGTPNPRWWPDRHAVPEAVRGFEAESVSYLVGARLGLKTESEAYLFGYLEGHATVPPISLDRILVSAGLIEEMGRARLPLRRAGRPRARGVPAAVRRRRGAGGHRD